MTDERRKALEAAFDASEKGEEAETPFAENEEAGGSDENAQEQVRVEEETHTPTPQELMDAKDDPNADKPKETTPTSEEETEKTPEKAAGEEEDDKSGESETDEYAKPPAGWNVGAREQWGDLPQNIRAEVIRRERAYAAGIQKYAEDGKFGQAIKQTLAPYAHIMAMEGADEIQTVANLAQYGAIMRQGTPMEKVTTIAEVIQVYGVDIEMLDNVLSGGGALTPEEQRLQQMLDNRLGPMEQIVRGAQEHQQNTNQSLMTGVDAEITAFEQDPKNEFINEVRSDMADLMDLAAKRGEAMTIQQAYDRAVKYNPEIQGILMARENRKIVEENRRKIADKEAASASVTGTIGGEEDQTPATRRDVIAQAYDRSVSG